MGLKTSYLITAILVFACFKLSAQKDSSQNITTYQLNLKYETTAAALGIGVTQYLYTKVPAATILNTPKALALKKEDVNRFDRPVLKFPSSGYKNAHDRSNYVMYSTFALPGILMLDKNIRRDWKEVATMYLQIHAVSSAAYLVSTFSVDRARPLAYNTSYPIELRSGESTNNAFFSGHVNSTAAAAFFMAKVYNDYNKLPIGKKILTYAAASIPPTAVALYRMRAGKHFRTDVITGFALGAATGILVPALHKKRKNNSLSFTPYYSNQQVGLVLNYKF